MSGRGYAGFGALGRIRARLVSVRDEPHLLGAGSGDGRVLEVPLTRGAVVLAGELVAIIGGGGFFLRLAIPERHAFSLREGAESNPGLTYKLLREMGAQVSVYYEPGIQWSHWRHAGDVIAGREFFLDSIQVE